LLNLAVTDIYQGNRSQALQAYRDYLEIAPHGSNWDAVSSAAAQLDEELNPPPARPPTNAMPGVVSQPGPTPTTMPAPANTSRTDVVASVTRPPAVPIQPTNPPSVPVPAPEMVRVPEAPVIRPADSGVTSAPVVPRPATPSPEIIGEPPVETAPAPTPEKRSFFQRLNPLTLFRREPKPPAKAPAVVAMTSPMPAPNTNPVTAPAATNLEPSKPVPAPVLPMSFARYPYLPVSPPAAGNRAAAERLVAQGSDAQRDHRLNDALGFYRAAAHADPGYFEAFSSMGSAASDLGDVAQAARAYEMALAVRPESFDARFNFGLALKRANYIVDAAQELERLLASSSTREAPARLALLHLTLGNLYAQEFNRPALARPHYLKVLELDPANSQATAIRFWLQSNP
jgi:hypothetical protein